jgi:hypothetical protein
MTRPSWRHLIALLSTLPLAGSVLAALAVQVANAAPAAVATPAAVAVPRTGAAAAGHLTAPARGALARRGANLIVNARAGRRVLGPGLGRRHHPGLAGR